MPSDREAVGPHQLVSAGGTGFRVEVAAGGGQWVATARRVDTGDRFGPALEGATAEAAIERLRTWLIWQHEHQDALEALQDAERAYQRLVAASLLATGVDGASPVELTPDALSRLEEARRRLDEIRQQKPG